MQIEHVAMYVEDLEKTKDFFIKYFHHNDFRKIQTGSKLVCQYSPVPAPAPPYCHFL